MTIKILLEKYRKASYAYSYALQQNYSYALRQNYSSEEADQKLQSIGRDLDEAGFNLRKAVEPYGSDYLNKMSSLIITQLYKQGSYISALIDNKEKYLIKAFEDFNKASEAVDKFIEELDL
ncbi:hypothetical protein CkP1_0239 [Citrobacter phage CkP1]|nr:hypothetical protein CkP1_0239 [Citrobacter phage CkP1]